MIQINNFTFAYRESKKPVVRDINLVIPDGAFVGITGSAGSGKSTLTYAMNGIIPHCYPGDFYGSVLIDGIDTCEASLTDISQLVGSVCQDIDSQIVSSIVEDELLYGLENFGVPKGEIDARVEEALADMGISDLRDRVIASLSGGQKQKVAIASILALKPRVLMLDEPTAELDPASSLSVFQLLARYAREHGTTVVVVEQKIALLSEFADMLVIVDGGRIRFADSPSAVLAHSDELLEIGVNCPRSTTLMNRLAADGVYDGSVCRNVEQACKALVGICDNGAQDIAKVAVAEDEARVSQTGRAHAFAEADSTPLVEFCDVCASYDTAAQILKDMSFKVDKGEFVAFVGTNGAGKSTTMRLVNGLLKPDGGEVLVDGVPTTALKTSELARRVGFLFQNPDSQICCNTVRDELLFGFKALGQLDEAAERRVDEIIAEFSFNPDDDPFLLNRGTRQLLALASIVVLAPPIIVLDEPTTGLDFRECVKVMNVIRKLHEKGATVIMVCHDMEVVADFADRIIVMSEGQVVDQGSTFKVLRNRRTLDQASLVPPQIVDISLGLSLMRPELRETLVGRANTLNEMEAAMTAAAGMPERASTMPTYAATAPGAEDALGVRSASMKEGGVR